MIDRSTGRRIDGILIGIPIGDSVYIVVKNGKVVRGGRACGAHDAWRLLKPKKGEKLYIEVGGQQ